MWKADWERQEWEDVNQLLGYSGSSGKRFRAQTMVITMEVASHCNTYNNFKVE